MPHHHAQHARNMGPNLFTHNENSAYVMPRVTACAVTSCTHRTVHAHWQVSHPIYPGMPGITYGHAIHASQTIFIKNNCLTF